MAGDSLSPRGTGWPELDGASDPKTEAPTQAAELKVAVGLATAGGRVPQSDAHHFITVGGIAWCVAVAIAGVVLTLQIAGRPPGLRVGSGLTVLALGELGLGLLGAVLVAICDRRRAHRAAASAEGRAGRPATHPVAVGAEEGDGYERRPEQAATQPAAGEQGPGSSAGETGRRPPR
jgi:hypothetical protein